MSSPDLTSADWRKGNCSTETGGSLIEVEAVNGVIAVRDSKRLAGCRW